MDELLKYKMIGIGEFSHGIEESWIFRLELLKYAIKYTNKKIFIFNEQSIWCAQNIMNNTIWSRKLNKFIDHPGIKKEDEINNNYIGGKLWQYMAHSLESKIFLKIIKYIRKNKKRITLVGTDNDTLDRDYPAYKIIMKNYNFNNINFYWAHNHHVDDLLYSPDNMLYIKNKSHKWFCGHYLKKKLKDDYCIVLSQAYSGTNRFNGYCIGKHCHKRNFQLKYIYKKFIYPENKKYVDKKYNWRLLNSYDCPLISFSNSYYTYNKYGVQEYTDTNTSSWNYILFFNTVKPLIAVYNYS